MFFLIQRFIITLVAAFTVGCNINDNSLQGNISSDGSTANKGTVAFSVVSGSDVAAGPFQMAVTFSKDTPSFSLAQLNIVNGTASTLAGGPRSYTFSITPTATGPVNIMLNSTEFSKNLSNPTEEKIVYYDLTSTSVDVSKAIKIYQPGDLLGEFNFTVGAAKPYDMSFDIEISGSTTSSEHSIVSKTVTIPANQTSVTVLYDILTSSTASTKSINLKITKSNTSTLTLGTTTRSKQYLFNDKIRTYSMLSTQANSGCGITSDDGTLVCWGQNSSGQLGIGKITLLENPTEIDAGVKYSYVSAAVSFTCGITVAGVLKCWGENSAGELGDGTQVDQTSPVTIDAGTTYTMVSTNTYGGCAIASGGATAAGTLKCWGSNTSGRVGDGTTTLRPAAVAVSGGASYIYVAAGVIHTCAIKSDNRLQCWGEGTSYRLGNSNTADQLAPVDVDVAATYVSLAATWKHTCGILTSGAMKCWGQEEGILGYDAGAPAGFSTPQLVDAGTLYQTLAVYGSAGVNTTSTCGLTTAGVVRCWGARSSYPIQQPFDIDPQIVGTIIDLSGPAEDYCTRTQVGSVTGIIQCSGNMNRHVPKPEKILANTTTVNQLASDIQSNVCRVSSLGVLQCSSGGLYETLDASTQYQSVSTSDRASCGITTAGDLKCWGLNSYGGVGDGTTTAVSDPKIIDSGVKYKAISNGLNHTCGITTTDALKCWGGNSNGEVGNNTKVTQTSPLLIDGGQTYKMVSAGYASTCGITADTDQIKCWGRNDFGQLGDGTTTERLTPTLINGGTTYSFVNTSDAVGGIINTPRSHSCAITSTGALHCWGDNTWGQLGDGTTVDKTTPQLIDSGVNYQSISTAGGVETIGFTYTYSATSCGVTSAGALKCWGSNQQYQLGLNNQTDQTSPQAVDAAVTYNQVALGNFYGCGKTTANEVKCWGNVPEYFELDQLGVYAIFER